MMPIDSAWQKSSFSGGEDGDNCIELSGRATAATVALRESENSATALVTAPVLIAHLIRHLKDDERKADLRG